MLGCCRILGCQHCNVKASGNLLPSLALLDQLQELHLDRNWFNGTLPPAFAYGFPALTSLRLDFNSLTVWRGTMHASLMSSRSHTDMHGCRVTACQTHQHHLADHGQGSGCACCLQCLVPSHTLTRVIRSQGVIPPDWGQPGAFPSLQHLNIGGNQLKGKLPEMGVGAMSKLQVGACTLPSCGHCLL